MSNRDSIDSTLRRYADAWAASDTKAIIDCYHDEVVFHYFGHNPLAGVHCGKAACLAVLKQVRERTNRRLVKVLDVAAGETFGFVIARERFEREGNVAEVTRVLKYTVRENKLAECWIYDEDQALIDRFFA